MSKTVDQTKQKQISSRNLSILTGVSKSKVTPKSIVLEQNGEKKILKKIKLKTPLKVSPDLRQGKQSKPQNNEASKRTLHCTFCKATFDDQEALKKHFVKHGSESAMDKNPDLATAGSSTSDQRIDLIECEWCPETFTRLSKAIEHKYRKHSYESKNYFCTLCGRLFPLKVALDQHRNIAHKDDKKMKVIDKTLTIVIVVI